MVHVCSLNSSSFHNGENHKNEKFISVEESLKIRTKRQVS